MSVSTKSFVTVEPETISNIMPILIKRLNEWQRDLSNKSYEKSNFDSKFQFFFNNKDWTNGIKINTTDFKCFTISFKVDGEARNIFITNSCSNDYSDTYKGSKIIFSLNKWGMCETIMDIINETLKEFGDVYYTKDDCSEEFVKID